MFQTYSVKGFFEAMAPLVQPPLTLAHRFVDSEAGLAYYTKRPDGLMWRSRELFDTPIYYLAFHGSPGSVIATTGTIGSASSREFLKRSRMRAVIGYSRTVGWMASLVCDLLFLHRFYRDPAPWKNLRRIFNSVQRDYPAARRLGWTLVMRR